MRHNPNNQQRESGFTIPEVVITIVFIGFVALGITQLFTGIQDIQRRTGKLETATHAAQTEVEALRNNNYGQLINGVNINFSSQIPSSLNGATGTVVVSEPQTGIKRVDVTVTYKDRGITRNVKLSSLIGIIGISQ
ncbi:hypothetical protein BH09PAT4_BH09PAT4_02040 [soil metagenome]